MVVIPVTLLGLYFGDVYFESRSVPVIGYLTQEFTDSGLTVALATVFCTVAVPLQILSNSFITFPLPSLPTHPHFNFFTSLHKFLSHMCQFSLHFLFLSWSHSHILALPSVVLMGQPSNSVLNFEVKSWQKISFYRVLKKIS